MPAIEMLEEASARAGFFEEDQYRAVAKRLPDDLQAAVAIAHTYGWRIRSEVLPLERHHLDLRTGTLRLDPGTTKNGDGRVVYLTPELKLALAAHVECVDELEREVGRIIPARCAVASARCGRGRAVMMGCQGDFATSAARAVRTLERAGVPRSVAMKITGHKTESVYRRYAIVSDADLQDAARKPAGTFSGTFARSESTHVPSPRRILDASR